MSLSSCCSATRSLPRTSSRCGPPPPKWGWWRKPLPTPGPAPSRSVSGPSSHPRWEAWSWPCRTARATGWKPVRCWSSSTAVPSGQSSFRREPRSTRRKLRRTRHVSQPNWRRRSCPGSRRCTRRALPASRTSTSCEQTATGRGLAAPRVARRSGRQSRGSLRQKSSSSSPSCGRRLPARLRRSAPRSGSTSRHHLPGCRFHP